MKKLKKLPPPLRKQALLRFAGAGACFCLLLLVAVGYRQPMLWFPFLVMGVFSAGQRRPAGVGGRTKERSWSWKAFAEKWNQPCFAAGPGPW